jgi:hypothetical protein
MSLNQFRAWISRSAVDAGGMRGRYEALGDRVLIAGLLLAAGMVVYILVLG